jgi:hypothetical protein
VIDSSPQITQTRSSLLLRVTQLHPDGEVTSAHGGLPLAGSAEGKEGEDDVDFETDFQELNKTGIESVDEARSLIHFA